MDFHLIWAIDEKMVYQTIPFVHSIELEPRRLLEEVNGQKKFRG